MQSSYLDDRALKGSVSYVEGLNLLFTAGQQDSLIQALNVEDYKDNTLTIDVRSYGNQVEQYIVAHKMGLVLSSAIILKERGSFILKVALGGDRTMVIEQKFGEDMTFSEDSVRYVGPMIKQILASTIKDVGEIVKEGASSKQHNSLYKHVKELYSLHISDELNEALDAAINLSAVGIDGIVRSVMSTLYL